MTQVKEIYQAFIDYADQKVLAKLIKKQMEGPVVIPEEGTDINPNETFVYGVYVKNAEAVQGGVPVRNIRVEIRMETPTLAAMIVPPKTVANAYQDLNMTQSLDPGTLVDHMYLRPSNGAMLDAGGQILIENLKGKAKAKGKAQFYVRAYVDFDFDTYVKGQNTVPFQTKFDIKN